MTLLFNIEQSITQDSIYFKDNTVYDSDISITEYNIIYKPYLSDSSDTEYIYTITDEISIASMLSGIYIDTTDFNEGLATSSILDGAYSFTIKVTYNDLTSVSNIETLEYVALFYQGIYNTYSQIHLDYDWTKRYKELNSNLLDIAEELTWIDSLRLASENQSRPDEFVSILNNLQNYFTIRYDY